MKKIVHSVGEEHADFRLDRAVASLAGITRSHAQRLLEEGKVRVDGVPRPKNHRLRPGSILEIELPEEEEFSLIPREIPLNILYQDEHLAVISKPAGLVVHPASGHWDDTLVNALLVGVVDPEACDDKLRPGIVHRLDRDTSGLMVVAKSWRAKEVLQRMIRERILKRYYLCLVHGVPATRLGRVEAPIGRDPVHRRRMAVRGEGKPAVTLFRLLRDYGEASLLEVELITGRTHQVRVHMSYIGHPVVGDPEYGRRGELEKRLGIHRQFLHAHRLEFPHPFSGEALSFRDPLPQDLEDALQKIEEGRI